jgi:hypothetical protein
VVRLLTASVDLSWRATSYRPVRVTDLTERARARRTISPDRRSLHLRATAANEVVLVRLGAVTHGQDADLRAVVLEHTAGRGGRVTAALPKEGDGRLVPPGAYYVFVNRMTPEGPVPSVARTVLVEPDGAATGAVAFARL